MAVTHISEVTDANPQFDGLERDVRAGHVRRIVAPGGFGKSAVLEALAGRLADLEPRRLGAGLDLGGGVADSRPLLLDDGHLLEEERLRTLLATRSGVVVAHRPVQGSLARLLDLVDRTPVVLSRLDHEAARDLLAERWGERPTPTVTDGLLAATGGVPRLLLAMADDGPTPWPRVTPLVEELVRAERRALSDTAARVLLGLAVLDGLDRRTLALACGLDSEGFDAGLRALVDAGLVLPRDARLIGIVAEAMTRIWTDSELSDLAQRAADVALDGDEPVVIAERLLTVGARGPAIGRCLLRGATHALQRDPARVTDLLAAAYRAGAEEAELAYVRVVAAFHAGRLDDVLAGSDEVLHPVAAAAAPGTAQDAVMRARRAIASVLAVRGSWSRAALVADVAGVEPDLPVLCHLALGRVDRLDEILVGGNLDQGGHLGATTALATGLLASVGAEPGACLLQLIDAVRLDDLDPPEMTLPEPPRVVTAIVATHLLELDLAADLLEPPLRSSAPWAERRRRLTAAWVALRRGDWNGAEAVLDQLHASPAWSDAEARDQLVSDAVRAGAARRRGDLEALVSVWRRARTQLLRTAPDLLTLGPLGELLIAGARLGDHGTVGTVRSHVDGLLERAGDPALWAAPMRWDQLHLAVVQDDLAAARVAAAQLDALPAAGPRGAVYREVATVWVDALDGEVEVERVRGAAHRLADVGLVWEAARLAGAAAIRARDSEQMRTLLHFARGLPAPSAPSLVDDAGELSAREQEVAAHLLSGLTYRQIGAQLFIAPKTVEHHVARIRRKLGVTTRAELLLVLRRHLAVGSPEAG